MWFYPNRMILSYFVSEPYCQLWVSFMMLYIMSIREYLSLSNYQRHQHPIRWFVHVTGELCVLQAHYAHLDFPDNHQILYQCQGGKGDSGILHSPKAILASRVSFK